MLGHILKKKVKEDEINPTVVIEFIQHAKETARDKSWLLRNLTLVLGSLSTSDPCLTAQVFDWHVQHIGADQPLEILHR